MPEPEFAGKTVLVVGGAGFVGGNLVARLVTKRPRHIVVVDNLLSGDIDNLPEDRIIDFRLGSIADDRVLAALPDEIDYVFHLACYHGNQSSIHDPLADHRNNTLTTLKLFDHLKRRHSTKKIVYAGAGCAVAEKTFGDAAAVVEDAPVSLSHDTPYAISKLIGEMYANFYFRHHGLPVVTARFQNVYGPGEVLGAGQWRGTPHTVWRNVIPTFIWKALYREPLPVENGGVATRDFIYVDDIVDGLLACALRGEPGDVYNLASGVETSILDLANLINELTDNPTRVAMAPARDWDRSGRRFGDPQKARERLGFAASVPLRDGLARTIEWTRTNRARIGAAMLRHARFMPGLRDALAGGDAT